LHTTQARGDVIEVYSASNKAWMPGKIHEVLPDGEIEVYYGNNSKKTIKVKDKDTSWKTKDSTAQ
jgi:hypothetical protein